MAAFWLLDDHDTSNPIDVRLDQLIQQESFEVSNDIHTDTLRHISEHEIGSWLVGLCHLGHPHVIWNFMMDSLMVSKNDRHLDKIANELGVHILAHYGSLMEKFETVAARNPLFARMATGIWRHRMSDDVWMRLRKIQAGVEKPLPSMLPMYYGVDHWYGDEDSEDRKKPDKGIYVLNTSGEWEKG